MLRFASRICSGGVGGHVDMVGGRVQYKKAADQYALSCMLREGEGGPVDMVGARVYLKKAADQGDLKSQNNLASQQCTQFSFQSDHLFVHPVTLCGFELEQKSVDASAI